MCLQKGNFKGTKSEQNIAETRRPFCIIDASIKDQDRKELKSLIFDSSKSC